MDRRRSKPGSRFGRLHGTLLSISVFPGGLRIACFSAPLPLGSKELPSCPYDDPPSTRVMGSDFVQTTSKDNPCRRLRKLTSKIGFADTRLRQNPTTKSTETVLVKTPWTTVFE